MNLDIKTLGHSDIPVGGRVTGAGPLLLCSLYQPDRSVKP